MNNQPVYEIAIPDGITEIKARVFMNCINIKSVVLPESVTTIGEYAFAGCSNLLHIELSEQLLTIGRRAFSGCNSLEKMVIPDSVTELGVAWLSSNSIKELTIGNGVVKMGQASVTDADIIYYNAVALTYDSAHSAMGCFAGNVNRFVVGKDVTQIPYGFSELTIANLEFETGCVCNNIRGTFGKGACNVYITDLDWWNGIDFVNYQSNPMYGGGNLYLNGKLVTEVVIPVGNTVGYGYVGCNSITTVIIPEGVTVIDEYAFYNCSNLSSVSMPQSLKEIGKYAFYACERLTQVVIPDGVTRIGSYAFQKCSFLYKVTIGRSVNNIGSFAFSDCKDLIEVYNRSALAIKYDYTYGYVGQNAKNIYTDSSGSSKFFTTEDGFLFYQDDTYSFLWKYVGDSREITLPDSCNGKGYTIHNHAFDGLPITKVTMSVGVEDFYKYPSPFANCKNLVYLNVETIPDHMKSNRQILQSLFDGVYPKVVYDPHSYCHFYNSPIYIRNAEGEKYFTTSEGYWFYESETECYLLDYTGNSKHMILPSNFHGKTYQIVSGSIMNRQDILSITIPDGIAMKNDITLSLTACTSLKRLSIGNGIQSVSLENCNNLTSIELHEGIVSISIKNANSLASIDIPESVSSVYLQGCSRITELRIPDAVTEIPAYAFYNCYSLKSITLGENITTIGDYAFKNCRNLEALDIPDSVTAIGQYACAGCRKLSDLSIGKGMISIGNYAFDGCIGLEYLYYNAVYANKLRSSDCIWNLAGCHGIRLVIGKDVETIPESAFRQANIISVDFEDGSVCESIEAMAFINCSLLENVKLSPQVSTIGKLAFGFCVMLKNVYIPESVITIGSEAFCDCPILDKVYIDSIEHWCQIDFANGTANPLSNGADLYCQNVLIRDFVIPETITTIAPYAFYASCITSLSIHTGVVSIGQYAFSQCALLEKIYFNAPEIQNMEDVFDNSGSQTKSMTLIIGKDVTQVPSNMIRTPYLKSVAFEAEGCESLGDSAFAGCSGLVNIDLPDSITTFGDWGVFGWCTSLTRFEIPEGCTFISLQLFDGCVRLTEIIIPKSVMSIGYRAFYDCKGLTDVYFTGTEEEWAAISKGENNYLLTTATIHFNYVP